MSDGKFIPQQHFIINENIYRKFKKSEKYMLDFSISLGIWIGIITVILAFLYTLWQIKQEGT